MTPTTDLQKLLAEATKGPWLWIGNWLYGCDRKELIVWYTRDDDGTHSSPPDARLIAMAPDLAARVLELEADNARLREGLIGIENIKPIFSYMTGGNWDEPGSPFDRGLLDGVNLCKAAARAALKGGEI